MTPKHFLIVGALLTAVVLALGFFWPFGQQTDVLRLPGIVEIQEVRLGSKVGGRVESVEVAEGSVVEPGRTLVRFEVPELRAQREQWYARLQAAQATAEKARNGPRTEEKEAARAALEAAQARLQRMKTGFREEEKRQAQSELESAEADLKWARDDFDRADRLYRQNSVSRAECDAARASRDRALGRVAAARARADLMLHGNRLEDIAEAEAEVARNKANYDLLLAGTRPEDVAAAEAQVIEAQGKLREMDANLAEAEVRAPERSVVEVVAVRKGDLVAPNQPVIRVLRAEDLWVKVYVPETELGKVRLNQSVEVTVDAYPDKRFTGTVMQIAAESEFTPRNIQSVDERKHQVFGLKIHIPDPQGVFKSGMAAEVLLPLNP